MFMKKKTGEGTPGNETTPQAQNRNRNKKESKKQNKKESQQQKENEKQKEDQTKIAQQKDKVK